MKKPCPDYLVVSNNAPFSLLQSMGRIYPGYKISQNLIWSCVW